jgi:hypothetical protein
LRIPQSGFQLEKPGLTAGLFALATAPPERLMLQSRDTAPQKKKLRAASQIRNLSTVLST